MIRTFVLSVTMGALVACNDVQPKEERATIVAYDVSRTSCGGSWIIQVREKQLRTLELPTEYRQANAAVLIRYEPDLGQSAVVFPNCNFIKLTSIRKQ